MRPFCVPWWWRLSFRLDSAGGIGGGRPDRDPGDLDLRERLAMALPLVVAGLVLELVDDDLRALGVGHDLSRHRHLLQGFQRCGDRRAIDEQDSGKRDGSAGFALELLDLDDVTLGDLVLLAAGLDDRVHRGRAFLPVVMPVCPVRWSALEAVWPPKIARKAIDPPSRDTQTRAPQS